MKNARVVAATALVAAVVTLWLQAQTSIAVTGASAQHRCDGPARHAIARADGKVIGRERRHGGMKRGKVWLKPLIDGHPVIGDEGRIDARLAVPQLPVQLLKCHDRQYRIRYPACEEWLAGTIRAREPNTRRDAVRIVRAPKTPPALVQTARSTCMASGGTRFSQRRCRRSIRAWTLRSAS